MGNRITASGGMGEGNLKLSNGATDVLFDVLTLSGSVLASRVWEQHLVLYFADGHRIGRGDSGFDLADLPWSADWRSERSFFVEMIAQSRRERGRNLLNYRPELGGSLLILESMVSDFVPLTAAFGRWCSDPDPAFLARCQRHSVYVGELGCRLCEYDSDVAVP